MDRGDPPRAPGHGDGGDLQRERGVRRRGAAPLGLPLQEPSCRREERLERGEEVAAADWGEEEP